MSQEGFVSQYTPPGCRAALLIQLSRTFFLLSILGCAVEKDPNTCWWNFGNLACSASMNTGMPPFKPTSCWMVEKSCAEFNARNKMGE